MLQQNRLALAGTLCLFLAPVQGACTADAGGDRPAEEVEGAELTKEEASRTAKADWGDDFCALAGWYGDGVCDDWCPELDPDCAGEGTCSDNADCGTDSYCRFDSCFTLGALGTCTVRPEFCIEIYDPVCSCDGATQYGNDCHAVAAGEPAFTRGECPSDPEPEPDPATCFVDADCGAQQYCAYDSCFTLEANGTCRDVPDACAEIYDPVCACDGTTQYSNHCYAIWAGEITWIEGECPSP